MKGKKIKGYPKYSVTENGEVWSYRRKKPRKLKPQKATQSKKKYEQVRLYSKNDRILPNGKRLGILNYIHRLVYEAYIGEIPEKMTIDHKDDNPSNNHYTNLQLASQSENSMKGQRGRRRDDLWNNREEVLKKYKELGSQKKTAEFYDCSEPTIWRIVNNVFKTTINGKVVLLDRKKRGNDKLD